MRLGVLFSGGKDSTYALYLARKAGHEISCLLTVESENPESYMFHTPNISLTTLQAESMGIPLLSRKTKGVKEKELSDLQKLIKEAVQKFAIEGVVTGAIASVYQASRVQRICFDLGLWCFNPLWLKDQVAYLKELYAAGFKTIITGVFAYPLDDSFLGKKIDEKMIKRLIELGQKYQFNPSGEGGEIETLVLDCPLFKKKIMIKKAKIVYGNHAGIFKIEGAVLK